jgi:GNAT superfamily N-acetyltransferase
MTIFRTEFRDQHITTIPSCISFILEHWKNGDSFYILLDTDQFVAGGAAIDTKHNEPFISNIFTVPSARNKGFGRILMRYCEDYSIKMGFKYAKLWCDEDLIQYYTKQGYIVEKKQLNSHGETVHIMTKRFIS